MWDVIIVGAGPAGSALASLLAEKGHSILLADSASFPREKLCGEYINPGCLEMLEQVGVRGEVEPLARKVRGMRVRAPDGTVLTAHHPEGRYGLAIRRTRLDHLLLRQAKRRHVECLEGFRVEKLLIEGGVVRGVEGRHRKTLDRAVFRARLTAGADGRNSVVARSLGLFRWHPSHRKTALGSHYEGIDLDAEYVEVYLDRRRYCILNPLPDGTANVSLVVDHGEVVSAKGGLDQYFVECLQSLPGLAARLKGGRPAEKVRALGPLAHRTVRASVDGALMVGDAAGFYDPFTGEGVYKALRGAQLAARVMEAALEAGDGSARCLSRYDGARTREFRSRYRLEAVIQTILSRPALTSFTLGRLAASRQAAVRLMEVLGGLRPPRSLFSARLLGSLAVAGELH